VNDSTWTWISGNSTVNSPGAHGEQGVAGKEYFPGARTGAIGWYDNSKQEFWLFAGLSFQDTSA